MAVPFDIWRGACIGDETTVSTMPLSMLSLFSEKVRTIFALCALVPLSTATVPSPPLKVMGSG